MPKRPERNGQVRTKSEQLLFNFDVNPLLLMSVDEIFDRADADLLLALKEDRRLERKPCNHSGDSLGEYFSMWANTPPEGGLIVSGQLDKGGFEGCKRLSTERINALEKTGYVYCSDARYDVRRIPVTNIAGEPDCVLLFRVKYHRDIAVRTSNGKVFVRKGDSKIELKKPEEIRELQADKGQVSFEQQPSGLRWPDDFDLVAVQDYVGKVRTRRNLQETLTVEEVLKLRHLGVVESGKFQPNYACALLFANDPLKIIPGCKVHFQRFEGEVERTGEQYNAVKDFFLEGTVPQLIQQVETTLESQLRTFSPLDASVKFFPVPEYPKVAWYEAVVNACVHRSYGNGMRNMPIFVKMFDDRLVIESPGPFPPFVTPSNIYDSHHPRNPTLMDAMFYLEYVKCAHEGTRRIRDTMAEMELPEPKFEQAAQGPLVVTVTLRNKFKQRRAWVDKDVAKIISEAIAADLTEDEKRLVNFAAESGTVKISDANRLIKGSYDRTRQLMLGLAQKRIFQYVRFRKFEKDVRDPKAFFRLRSNEPLPDGAFEQKENLDADWI